MGVYRVFYYVDVGVGKQNAHIVVICTRCDDVVGIDECDIFPSCNRYAGVTCRGEAAVLLVYYLYLVALLCVTVAHRTATIGRAIVDEDKFIVGVCLLQYAFYAILQVSSCFVYRYYDA